MKGSGTLKGKGHSKKACVLVADLGKATKNFVERGKQIAYENPYIEQQMSCVMDEIRITGKTMADESYDFIVDPCSALKRANMNIAARNLLSAVVRLLILADMVDIDRLVKSSQSVLDILEQMKGASTQEELSGSIEILRDNKMSRNKFFNMYIFL